MIDLGGLLNELGAGLNELCSNNDIEGIMDACSLAFVKMTCEMTMYEMDRKEVSEFILTLQEMRYEYSCDALRAAQGFVGFVHDRKGNAKKLNEPLADQPLFVGDFASTRCFDLETVIS